MKIFSMAVRMRRVRRRVKGAGTAGNGGEARTRVFIKIVRCFT